MDLINEAGAPDPRELAKEGKWDWAAFFDVAQKTRALGTDIYGYGASSWWAPTGVWMNAAGGGYYNADRTACALNTPESLEGLTFQKSIYDEGVAVPYGEDPEPVFRAGNLAMFQNGRWATPGARTVEFEWDVVDLPNGPKGTPGNWLFWGAYVINAKTEYPAEAWALVQALTTAQTQGKISALGANIPSRVSQEALDAFLTFTPPANTQAFLNGIAPDANPTAEGPLWAGSWPEFDKIMGAAVQGVLTGATTVEDYGATICDEANKVFTP
jgi:multiple sugar transport system substrate-binding protein